MSNNPARGENDLRIGEHVYIIRFTWNSWAYLADQFGDDVMDHLSDRLEKRDFPFIAGLVVAATRNRANADLPELSAEDVMEAGPPLQQTLMTVGRAITQALHGAQPSVQRNGEAHDEAASEGGQPAAPTPFQRPARPRVGRRSQQD